MKVFLGCGLAMLASPAFAYLDPGTGSILFQAAVAGLLAALFYIRTIWYRIKSFFTGKPHVQEKIELPPEEEPGGDAKTKSG